MLFKTIATIIIALNPYISFLGKPSISEKAEIAPAQLPLTELSQAEPSEERNNQNPVFAGLSNSLASLAVSASASANPDFLPIRDWNISEPEIKFRAGAITMVGEENLASPEKNKILFQREINQVLPIASVTKIMSALVVLDNLELDQITTVSRRVLEQGEGDRGRLAVNEKITAGNLLRAMLVESSNDAAMVLAEITEERTRKNFTSLMNKKAEEIGLKETKFSEPSGCSPENVSTAKELTELVKYSLNQPVIWEILRMKTIDTMSVDGEFVHHWVSTNELLGRLPNIVGGKTGYTEDAQGCMILVTEKTLKDSSGNNLKNYLITVVLGAEERFSETEKLINWVDKAYRW